MAKELNIAPPPREEDQKNCISFVLSVYRIFVYTSILGNHIDVYIMLVYSVQIHCLKIAFVWVRTKMHDLHG